MTTSTSGQQQPGTTTTTTSSSVPARRAGAGLDIAAGVGGAILAVLGAAGATVWALWLSDRTRRQRSRARRRLRMRYSRHRAIRVLYWGEFVGVAVGWLLPKALFLGGYRAMDTWDRTRAAAAAGWESGVTYSRTHRGYTTTPPAPPAPPTSPAGGGGGPVPHPGPTGIPPWGFPNPGAQAPRNGFFVADPADPREPAPAEAAPSPSAPVEVTVTVTDLRPDHDQDSRPAGEDVVDADVLCTWLQQDGSFCGAVLPDGEIFCPHHAHDEATPAVPAPVGPPSRRWDGEPETDDDRRFFDAREGGYDGWVDGAGQAVLADEHGWPVPAAGAGPQRYEAAGSDPADAPVPHPACAGVGCAICGDGVVPAWSVDPAYGVIPATAPTSPSGFPAAGTSVPAPAPGPVTGLPSPIPGAVLAPVAATPAAHHPASPTGRNHPAMTTTTSTVATSTSRTSGGIATDLRNIQDLKLETARAQVALEQFEALGKLLQTWAKGLSERVDAAPFGTKAINAAAAGVGEHANKSGALGEQLQVLNRACAQAEGLGDHIGGLQAEGQTAAFTNQ